MPDRTGKDRGTTAEDEPRTALLTVASKVGWALGTAVYWVKRAWSGVRGLRRRDKVLVSGGVAAVLLAAALSAWVSVTLPLSDALEPLPDPALSFVGADGSVFARRGGYKEDPVAMEEVPPHFVDALLAMEDRRFYYHFGIDPLGIARAAWNNFQAGEIVEGGSTITQQLAKISFLSREKTFSRKFQEAVLAVWLETQLTKEEILVRYLSSAYFGSGAYGLGAAARHYFDKPVSELTLSESAMLVGLLRAPSRYAPTRDLETARARARLVLDTMVEDERLTAEEAAATEPARLSREQSGGHIGSYFADWVAGQLPEIEGRYGDIRVGTTLDAGLQRSAERIVRAVLDEEGARRGASQAALVAMRPDGRIVAMVGGRDYEQSQFNRATQAQRQPGSAFKLFVYLAALRDGASLRSSVPDRPIDIDGWRPENFNGRYRGRVSLREAFAGSINVPTVIISETAGRRQVIRAARDLGITSQLKDAPSLALGASEVSLVELTAAYACVAAGYYPVRPRAVTAIDGTAFGQSHQQRYRQLAFAAPLRELLYSVVHGGTGRSAGLDIPAFGKTGTSQEYRDAWFIGYAGNLVTGVWVGNDDSSPMKGVTGGSLPARIWSRFMSRALETDAIAMARPSEDYARRRGGGGGLRELLRSFGLGF